MPKKPEYLKFQDVDNAGLKTRRVEVRTVNSNVLLGVIAWYSHWRQYVFFPEPETIFNPGCLGEIGGTAAAMTRDHRMRLRKYRANDVH